MQYVWCAVCIVSLFIDENDEENCMTFNVAFIILFVFVQ